MKRAQKTDLIREMKKSFNRYISIMAIMALGVSFYTGVRSSEPDMQLSAKKYFNETNYMDIRVLGTLGMTEDDVEEIKAIDFICGGVARCFPEYALGVANKYFSYGFANGMKCAKAQARKKAQKKGSH